MSTNPRQSVVFAHANCSTNNSGMGVILQQTPDNLQVSAVVEDFQTFLGVMEEGCDVLAFLVQQRLQSVDIRRMLVLRYVDNCLTDEAVLMRPAVTHCHEYFGQKTKDIHTRCSL